jgi:hypothetical protein
MAGAIKAKSEANKSRKPKREKGRVSLYPLDFEAALRGAIATGPITDPDLKPEKRPKKR